MITRDHLRLDTALRYSWKNIIYSLVCAGLAYAIHEIFGQDNVYVPTQVVSVLGVALAIILAFRNSSAYDRWWEARKIWGGVVNDSRSFMRQAMTMNSTQKMSEDEMAMTRKLVRSQVAWVNALRLQLREKTEAALWDTQVGAFLDDEEYRLIMSRSNKVTQISVIQGRILRELQVADKLDLFSYIQISDTLTRLTDLQGKAERIKSTPLPKPYDYYTRAFLNLFIIAFPFAFIDIFRDIESIYLIFPVTALIGWIFYQLFVFGKVMSSPFANFKTDVALHAISNVIEIDLRETIEDKDVPEKMKPVDGALM